MSCHYSCSTCATKYYFDGCSTCPATRTLLGSICSCKSGYYEAQQAQCPASSAMSSLDSSLIAIANIAYYVAIGFHLLSLILLINRIYSVKLKKILDCLQITALITYYRYLYQEVAIRSLNVMDTLNFNYLTNLICTQQGPPYHCLFYENIIGPALTFLLFLLILFASFLVGTCIYTKDNDSSIIYIRDRK